MTPNVEKRDAEGTDEPLFRENWTACMTRPKRIAGALAEVSPAIMPGSSSPGCSITVL